jgi:hypothetical protein
MMVDGEKNEEEAAGNEQSNEQLLNQSIVVSFFVK